MFRYYKQPDGTGKSTQTSRENLVEVLGEEEVSGMEQFAIDNDLCATDGNVVTYDDEEGGAV